MSDENSAGDLRHLSIGNDVYIGDGVYVDLADEIRIGNEVTIAGRCSFLTHADCNRSPWLSKQYPRQQAPVTIEDGAWVGFGATLLPGITVATESVVAAGSVVTEDTEPQTVYGGNPATKIASIGESKPEERGLGF